MINPDASMIEICCSLIIAYLYVSICRLNSFSNLDETAKKNAPFGSYIKTSSGNSILSIILSYIVYPIYKVLSRSCNNMISIIIIYLSLILFILFLVYSIIPNTHFINKIVDLLTNLLKFIDRLNIKRRSPMKEKNAKIVCF